MAGHSKWANIQYRKGAQDKKRAKLFTKFGKELTIAAKEGGGDPNFNPRLRLAIEKAKAGNMPKDILERAIKKGTGELEGVDFIEMRYEGYGPVGTAFIVDVVTDNKNRSAGNVRSAFTKGGGNMGTSGCVGFMFQEKGEIVIEKGDLDEDEIMMMALDAGAEDFSDADDSFEITTAPEDFDAVHKALEEQNIPMASAEVTMIPQTYVTLTDEADITNIGRILDFLDDDDDVQEVYHNWEE